VTAAKILTRAQMSAEGERAHSQDRTVVLTNGCFDVFHAGHVAYLQQAAEMGDLLFVGLNSDSSTRSLKGPGRPFNSQDDRAAVLAALEVVDAVAIFDELTAAELVRSIRPDVYVKGGDYSCDPDSSRYPVEGHDVRALGGVVRILLLAPGRSTSSLVERIRQSASSAN
jgi:rfaE bifunctional protein nucleotidyltransferase chain/domain